MTNRQQWSLAALFLVLAAAGCVRTAEGPREEQKNPFYLAGKERLQAMDYPGAAESFERALQDDPRSVLTHFELGVLYDTRLADYAAALYHYNKAIKLRPVGYPADTIKLRIPACRQELAKADSLAVLHPSALREMEKLREENQELRRQLVELRAAMGRALGATSPEPAPGAALNRGGSGPVAGTTPAGGGFTGSPNSAASTGSGVANARAGAESAAGVRSHVVRPGETVASMLERNLPVASAISRCRSASRRRADSRHANAPASPARMINPAAAPRTSVLSRCLRAAVRARC